MDNTFAVSTNTYHGFSLQEALKGISQAGFKAVELTAVKGYTEHVDWSMDEQAITTVKEQLASYQLEAVGLSGHSNLLTRQGLDNFNRNIELAHRLGCRYIITATGETHEDESEMSDLDGFLSTLHNVVHTCEERGLVLAIETHGNIFGSGERMMELVERLPAHSAGINYDTANVIFYGDTLPEEDLPRCVKRVVFMHLKDKAGNPREWNFPALGKGNIDFSRLFQILRENNYRGPMSVEVEFTSKGPGTLDVVNRAVQDSFNHIQGLLG